MSSCPTNELVPSAETFLAIARERLEPRLIQVIDALAADGDTGSFFTAGAFVQTLLERLRALEEEENKEQELPVILLDISLIGFQGFELSEPVQRAIDQLLDECERLAGATRDGNAQR